MAYFLYLIPLLAAQATSVDQIGGSAPVTVAPIASSSKTDTAVGQLPSTLDARGNDVESDLALAPMVKKTLAMEVVESWQRIKARGQTPTPGLIGQDIGEDKLALFLASSPLAANVVATGELPDGERPSPGSAGHDLTTAYAGDNGE